MSSYKKVASRLVVLGALIVGAWSLAQPAPVFALTCQEQCDFDYQRCVQQGQLGCDEVYVTCVSRCP